MVIHMELVVVISTTTYGVSTLFRRKPKDMREEQRERKGKES